MRLNPAGEVPVFVHNDNIICDPTQIMDYLEQNFTDGEAIWEKVSLALLFIFFLSFFLQQCGLYLQKQK